MIRNIAKILALANLTSFVLVGSAAAQGMMVHQAVARPSHVAGATSGAVYLTLMNHGTVDDELVAVKTDIAEVAEVHSSEQKDGVFSMRAVARVTIPAGGTVDFVKDKHIMLFGLKHPLKKDDGFQMTLDFANAPDLVVNVSVGDVVHLEHSE
jgi:periplasmic copper chaperone A